MTANVRCAGGGQWYETWEDAEIGADRNVPCGWTGSWIEQEETLGQLAADAACPSCGGQVEVVPTEVAR